MNNIVVLSGGFDPLHAGHILMFEEASKFGDIVVLLNSDEWLTRKKGRPFLKYEDREAILMSIKNVIDVFATDDDDDSVVYGLEQVVFHYHPAVITFANGGDRDYNNTPETDFCVINGINLEFNVGGDKTQSSNQILDAWLNPKTLRDWGHWSVLKEYNETVKVKELVVRPGQRLSMQRHKHRNEFWFVVEGTGRIENAWNPVYLKELKQYDIVTIEKNTWHQLINDGDVDLRIVEIQYGNQVVEEDIERLND